MELRGFGKRFSQRENNDERLLSTGHKRHVLGFMSTQTVTYHLLKTDRKLESEVVGLFKENSNLMHCLRTNSVRMIFFCTQTGLIRKEMVDQTVQTGFVYL